MNHQLITLLFQIHFQKNLLIYLLIYIHLNDFLELFSSDPDNMSNSKYVNKLNNFLNEINSNYICVNKLSVNDEGEIMWKFNKK